MDIQMVTGYNPQADAQKTAPIKGTDEKKGQACSEALSFTILLTGKENKLSQAWLNNYRLPEVSGFSMARKA